MGFPALGGGASEPSRLRHCAPLGLTTCRLPSQHCPQFAGCSELRNPPWPQGCTKVIPRQHCHKYMRMHDQPLRSARSASPLSIFFLGRIKPCAARSSTKVETPTVHPAMMPPVGPAKKSSQNLILKLLGMLAIPQFKARFEARKQF